MRVCLVAKLAKMLNALVLGCLQQKLADHKETEKVVITKYKFRQTRWSARIQNYMAEI